MVDARAVNALEFPKIIERLARLCYTPQGRARAEDVRPVSDLEEARRRHAQTAEAHVLRRLKPNFALGTLPTVDVHLLAASRHAALPAGTSWRSGRRCARPATYAIRSRRSVANCRC